MSKFEYDIFLVYPNHKNDDDLIASWALEFNRFLDIMLHRLLGESKTILMSDDIKTRQQLLNLNRTDILGKTALFLFIVDNKTAEDEGFKENVSEIFSIINEQRDYPGKRVFKIEIEPTSVKNIPQELIPVYGYDFFSFNSLSKKAHTIEITNDAKPDNIFWTRLLDLAKEMVHSLNDMHISHDKEKNIFLGHTTNDQKDTYDAIKRELTHYNYEVLPELCLSNNAISFEKELTGYLKQCNIGILILGEEYGFNIIKSEFSYQELQYQIISDYQEKNPDFKLYIFIKKGLNRFKNKQSLFIQRLKKQKKDKTEIIVASLPEFNQIIIDQLSEKQDNIAKNIKDDFVYLIHDKSNKVNQQAAINPFPGLRPFSPDESHFFFGREGQSIRVLDLLIKNKFIAVTGASGSGKSSLIYCGVIPALYSGYTPNIGNDWKVITTRPGNSPINNIAKELNSEFNQQKKHEWINIEIVKATLNYSSKGLYEVISKLNNDHQNILLVIDQFEELFRFNETRSTGDLKQETEKFIRLLEYVISSDLPVYIIITLRSDFIGECSAFAEFTRLINNSNFLIPKMAREDYKHAITGPIAVAGNTIEPQLVESILNSIDDNPDQLPIIQHVLMRTWMFWERKNDPEAPIGMSHYNSAGTIERAISLHANEAFESLTPEQKHLCKRIFQSLAVKGSGNRGIRQPAKVKDIAEVCNSASDKVIEIIEVFRQKDRSFLLPASNVAINEETVIDLSHESLMRVWDKLKGWVDEEVASAQMYMRLVEASETYQMGKGGLWRPPDLHLALNWRKTQQPNLAWAKKHHPAFERVKVFLDQSEKQYLKTEQHKIRLQRKALKRSRTFALLLGFFAITFMGMMFYANIQKSQADEARKIAENLRTRAEGQKEDEMKKREQFEYLAIITADSLEKQKQASIERSMVYQQEIEDVREDVSEAIKEKEEIVERTLIVEKEKQQAQESALQAQKLISEAEKEKREAYAKRMLSLAQSMSVKSLQITDKELKALLAYQAYIFNKRYNGLSHNADLYNALYEAMVSLRGTYYNGFSGHLGAIRSLKHAPNNNIMYSIGTDGKVLRWDINYSKTPVLLFKNDFINRSMDISADGKYLAVGNDQAFIQLFDLDKAKPSPIELKSHTGWVWALSFSPNNKYLISTGADTRIYLWDLENYSGIILELHNTRIRSLLFVNNTKFISGDDDGELIEWDIYGSKKPIFQNSSSIYSLAINPDNQNIAFGDKSGNVKIINPNNNNVVSQIQAHKSRIFDIDYSKTGKYLSTSSLDGTIKLWLSSDFTTRPIAINKHESWVLSTSFSNDEQKLVSASNKGDKIYVWATSTEQMASEICKYLNRNFTRNEWAVYVGSDIPYEATCNDNK